MPPAAIQIEPDLIFVGALNGKFTLPEKCLIMRLYRPIRADCPRFFVDLCSPALNAHPLWFLTSKMPTLAQKHLRKSQNITIDGLSYSYKGLEVFRDFALQADHKTMVLRGPSGCGKTTLLKLLSGNLIPDQAIAMPATESSCLVLQEDSLFPWLTGIENISIMTRMNPSQFNNHPMYELIEGFVGQKACRMSYGQRRLVELFRAIIFRPRFLYLDEPFNFLDEKRIGLVLPFLQGKFMDGINLTMSNHHRDDLALIESANVFQFDGEFPVSSIKKLS
jgi:ABC-type molybdenum transport system ATPase subunit/photorepair protein PhrA